MLSFMEKLGQQWTPKKSGPSSFSLCSQMLPVAPAFLCSICFSRQFFPCKFNPHLSSPFFYVCIEYYMYMWVCTCMCMSIQTFINAHGFMGLHRMNYNFSNYHHEYFPLSSSLQHILHCIFSLCSILPGCLASHQLLCGQQRQTNFNLSLTKALLKF